MGSRGGDAADLVLRGFGFAWNGGRGSGRVLVHCALLGPEATHVVSGVVFENCRVDASIFVVKLLRAHGGCLGFRSR